MQLLLLVYKVDTVYNNMSRWASWGSGYHVGRRRIDARGQPGLHFPQISLQLMVNARPCWALEEVPPITRQASSHAFICYP